jgi:hypothetical protein
MVEEPLNPTNQPLITDVDDEEEELLKRARELSLGEEAMKQDGIRYQE